MYTVNSMCAVCVQYACSMCAVCMQYVCSMCAVCVQYVCSMHAVCVQYVCSMCAVCAQYVCSMCAVCVQYACSMCTVCVQYVCSVCAVCVQYVCSMCAVYYVQLYIIYRNQFSSQYYIISVAELHLGLFITHLVMLLFVVFIINVILSSVPKQLICCISDKIDIRIESALQM